MKILFCPCVWSTLETRSINKIPFLIDLAYIGPLRKVYLPASILSKKLAPRGNKWSWLELNSYWCERPKCFSSGCSPRNISYSEKILGLKEYVAIAVCKKPLCECTSLYPVVPTVVSCHLKQKEQGRALETTVWAEEEKEIVTYTLDVTLTETN